VSIEIKRLAIKARYANECEKTKVDLIKLHHCSNLDPQYILKFLNAGWEIVRS